MIAQLKSSKTLDDVLPSSSGMYAKTIDACHRCGGLMMRDHCLDVASDTGEVFVTVLRCCACGELIDPTIIKNRKHTDFSRKLTGRRRVYSPTPQKLEHRH